MAETVYLDNNATTQPLATVVDAMIPFLRDSYANPSSVHRSGQNVRYAVERARVQVAELLGVNSREILFTSGGTESINLAIRGVFGGQPWRANSLVQPAVDRLENRSHMRFVTTAVEHRSVLAVADRLEREGYAVTRLNVDEQGRLNDGAYVAALDDRTLLVSLGYGNNETGVVWDIPRLAALAAGRDICVHVDAVQAVGKLPLDVSSWSVNLVSIAGHKFHGPKGVGALYVRSGTRLDPLMLGGGQERGLRGGTENVAAIVGMGVAAKAAMDDAEVVRTRMRSLRDLLEDGLRGVLPGVRIIAGNVDRLCNTSNVAFEGIQAEAMLLLLSEAGICASSGSACSSGSIELSHVLQAMGIDERLARGAIRFSLSSLTTRAEVDQVISTVARVLSRLRSI